MRALIDGKDGDFFKCLLESGDQLTVHASSLPKGSETGDVVRLQFLKDEDASRKQRDLMERLRGD